MKTDQEIAHTPSGAPKMIKESAGLILTTADATAEVAGLVGSAAVNGIVGGVRGAMAGIRDGASHGRGSTGAAALTLAALGAAGLVSWPIVVTVGGGALVVHEMRRRAVPAALPATSAGRRSQSASVSRKATHRGRPAG